VPALRRWSAAVCTLALTLSAGVPGARAQTVEEQARAAAATVAHLQPRVDAALSTYESSLDRLAHQVVRSVTADERADAQAATARTARRARVNQARSIYMAGGAPALYASVLTAQDTTAALRRITYLDRIMRRQRATSDAARLAADAARRHAARLDDTLDASVVTAGQVRVSYDALAVLLARAERTVARLDRRARVIAESSAAVAARRASADRAATVGGDVKAPDAMSIPADYHRLYVSAAGTCPGLPWQVLAAVGQVESGHGRHNGPSSAGALGPMQFMPATFSAYAVDGDGDGDVEIADPADAIFSAARYLCASGAGDGPAGVRRALYAYNHAQWYVELVLGVAQRLQRLGA
jgi:hypothetical protein